MSKVMQIGFIAIPVLLMIGLIPMVQNDYVLTAIYALIILVAFIVQNNKHDLRVLIFGFFVMLFFESLFVSIGVETFTRRSLFGLMPFWLPFLWAYGFVAIKRAIAVLG